MTSAYSFVCLFVSSHLRNATITGEGLQILTNTRHPCMAIAH